MVSKRKNKNTLRLHHYITNLVYQNGHISVKLPSVRQLAEEFNLAKSTVQLVIEDLSSQDLIYSKSGIGMFTVPIRSNTLPPLIGLLWADGKTFFQDYYIYRKKSAIALALAQNGFSIHDVNIYSSKVDEVKEELIQSQLDGLVIMHPPEKYNRIIKPIANTLPCMTVTPFNCFENINGTMVDFTGAIHDLVQTIIVENRKQILFAGINYKPITSLFKQAFKTKSYSYNEHTLESNPSTIDENFQKAISSPTPPEVIITNFSTQLALIKNLLKENNLDTDNKCRIIYFGTEPTDTYPSIIKVEEDYDEIGNLAAKTMIRLVIEKDTNIIHQSVPPIVKTIRKPNDQQES